MDQDSYLSELEAFYDELPTRRLKAPAIGLWHILMFLRFKTGRESLPIKHEKLHFILSMTPDDLIRARNELMIKRLVSYKSTGELAGEYSFL